MVFKQFVTGTGIQTLGTDSFLFDTTLFKFDFETNKQTNKHTNKLYDFKMCVSRKAVIIFVFVCCVINSTCRSFLNFNYVSQHINTNSGML